MTGDGDGPGRQAHRPERPARRRSGRARRLLWWLALSVLVVLAFRELDVGRVVEVARGASPLWMIVAVGANGLILALWALQWRLLLPPDARIGVGRVFGVTAVMSTAANGGPLLSGQAVGVHLLATSGGVGYARAVSVAALDQLVEGVAKVTLLGLVVLVAPLPGDFRPALAGLTLGVAVLGAGLFAAARAHDAGDLPLPGAARAGVLGRAWDTLLRAAGHLDALRSPATFGGALLLAGAMKAAELGGIVAAQAALGVDVGLGGSLLVLAAVGLATMVSVSPANLGVYEAAAFGAYGLAGVDGSSALALVLLQHALFLLPAAGTGWLLMTLQGLPSGSEMFPGQQVNDGSATEPRGGFRKKP